MIMVSNKDVIEHNKNVAISDIINNGLYIAYDNESNFGDVYVSECLDYINTMLKLNYTIDDLINDIEKDIRVLEVAGVFGNDTLDIVFTDNAIKSYEKKVGVNYEKSKIKIN